MKIGDRVRVFSVEPSAVHLGTIADIEIDKYGTWYGVNRLDGSQEEPEWWPAELVQLDEGKTTTGGNLFWAGVLAAIILFSAFGPKWSRVGVR